MNRFKRACLASVFVSIAGACFPLGASAQAAPTGDFTADQLRSQYIARGYQAETPVAWWTPNHVITFRVADPNSSRVVMVLVYPDAATAHLERASAEAREGVASGVGPHLIAGYSASTWIRNVALVQSSTQDLARQYAAEQAADNQLMTGVPTPPESVSAVTTAYAVDLDILDVLDSGTVNL
jgi:hypothetical protein